MKEGTAYAVRLKKAYAKVKAAAPTPEVGLPEDPLSCLARGVLGVTAMEDASRAAVERLLAAAVDWNEIRVSSPADLRHAIGAAIPEPLEAAERLVRALQALYDAENQLSLERLKTIPRREARQFLDGLDGMDPHAVAAVVLWGLGGHAIPVNDPLLGALQEADLVHPDATRAEVQAFLERHVSADEARDFSIVMRTFAQKHAAKAKRKAAGASKHTGKKARRTPKGKTKKKSASRKTKRQS